MGLLGSEGLQTLWTKIKNLVQNSLEGYAKKTDLFRKPSEGLSYSINPDTNSYIVTGIGICTDTDIVIPSTYNNRPVTHIGVHAFGNSQSDSIKSVVIPDSVTWIGEYAFNIMSSNLISVVIPDSVTYIGRFAFSSGNNLIIYCEAKSQPSGWDAKWNNANRTVIWGVNIPNYSSSGSKQVVKVDVMELLTTQNVDLFKALTTLYRNGDIILVASMGGTNVVVSYVDYVNDNHIGWGVSLPIPTYSDEAITEVVTTTFLILYQNGVLTYLTKESSDNSSGEDSSIIDLGTQDDHNTAQQTIIDYLTNLDGDNGCYLFKYYSDCSNTACFAIALVNYDDGVNIYCTVYDNGYRYRHFSSQNGEVSSECWTPILSLDTQYAEYLDTEDKTVLGAINEINSKIGSGGGAGLSMPRIRFANWRYDEDVIYSEESDFIAGKIVFSVNVQDGTVQEGDELQLCAMRKTFGKTKLRPILSRTITAEDIENLAKQPYLQISTDDCADNTLGIRVFNSLSKTDSRDPSARKPKYIRIRRPVWKENRDGEVVVVNALFSNVVPIQFGLKYEHIE